MIVAILKLIASGIEFFLGIPFVGGAFIFANAWGPLLFMLLFYIGILILSWRYGYAKWGAITGIAVSVIAVIPVVGMILHWVAFFVLLVDGLLNIKEARE
ncbi:hypothetical protein [Tenuibacillus multivorans]|uniref:Uncharacterized protein n=1 Tax=Tenuibacillus multivorans TaxID=237069 RepID=A0A1G9WY76_9BACI|nr:hypothetical protein [Tenuibacillus multivorans]GEL77306.1 hypothetical protein TMU01_15410 [Tenuibacillus multivorans]SDM89368.1 hypothetical protein SAMN05216498_0935 [Tenuibacillus multivorans]